MLTDATHTPSKWLKGRPQGESQELPALDSISGFSLRLSSRTCFTSEVAGRTPECKTHENRVALPEACPASWPLFLDPSWIFQLQWLWFPLGTGHGYPRKRQSLWFPFIREPRFRGHSNLKILKNTRNNNWKLQQQQPPNRTSWAPPSAASPLFSPWTLRPGNSQTEESLFPT